MVDAVEGILGIEWIDGQSVRKLLPGGVADNDEESDDEDAVDLLQEYDISVGVSSRSSPPIFIHAHQTS